MRNWYGSSQTMKVRKSDKIFSEYIREKANWCCEWDGKDFSDNRRNLHNSHYWSRSKEATRFDDDNCVALCKYHHDVLGHGDGRDDYRRFMIKRLGQQRFDLLEVRANMKMPKDEKLMILVCEQKLKDLRRERGVYENQEKASVTRRYSAV